MSALRGLEGEFVARRPLQPGQRANTTASTKRSSQASLVYERAPLCMQGEGACAKVRPPRAPLQLSKEDDRWMRGLASALSALAGMVQVPQAWKLPPDATSAAAGLQDTRNALRNNAAALHSAISNLVKAALGVTPESSRLRGLTLHRTNTMLATLPLVQHQVVQMTHAYNKLVFMHTVMNALFSPAVLPSILDPVHDAEALRTGPLQGLHSTVQGSILELRELYWAAASEKQRLTVYATCCKQWGALSCLAAGSTLTHATLEALRIAHITHIARASLSPTTAASLDWFPQAGAQLVRWQVALCSVKPHTLGLHVVCALQACALHLLPAAAKNIAVRGLRVQVHLPARGEQDGWAVEVHGGRQDAMAVQAELCHQHKASEVHVPCAGTQAAAATQPLCVVAANSGLTLELNQVCTPDPLPAMHQAAKAWVQRHVSAKGHWVVTYDEEMGQDEVQVTKAGRPAPGTRPPSARSVTDAALEMVGATLAGPRITVSARRRLYVALPEG